MDLSKKPLSLLILTLCLTIPQLALTQKHPYNWTAEYDHCQSIEYRIKPPQGFSRIEAPENSFASWLRGLPLKEGNPKVKLYNGGLKALQSVHFAVLNVDVGTRDLQQCADAVMRLKAEYHFAQSEYQKIHFKFTSGHNASYSKWRQGYRPSIKGNSVNWYKSKSPNYSYKSFKSYLNVVFSYAGTHSLSKELKPVQEKDIQPGDVFIWGGFPGHAIIVLDVVQNQQGEKQFLLAQSYMPAQEIHILRNLNEPNISPWYRIPKDGLDTPEWFFEQGSLKRFEEE